MDTFGDTDAVGFAVGMKRTDDPKIPYDLTQKIQLIIKSHFEHFLRRLQRRIAERSFSREEVAAYFCMPGSSGADLEALDVDIFGNIRNWPEKFFGDTMGDAVAMTDAQAQRMQAGETPQ